MHSVRIGFADYLAHVLIRDILGNVTGEESCEAERFLPLFAIINPEASKPGNLAKEAMEFRTG